jgi:hypothetical protein
MPCIVYRNQKVIYYAIEKCAITRLIWYFGTIYSFKERINEHNKPAEQIFYPAWKIFPSNIPLSGIKEKVPDYNEYFVFSFIRNPFDRVVSNYYFNRGPWKKRFGKWPSFEEYCLDIKNWNYLTPLSEHLDIDLDFIGRYERFKLDFDLLNFKLGTKTYTSKNHPLNLVANKSGRKTHYSVYYSKKAKKAIEHEYKKDLERFNYKFDTR